MSSIAVLFRECYGLDLDDLCFDTIEDLDDEEVREKRERKANRRYHAELRAEAEAEAALIKAQRAR